MPIEMLVYHEIDPCVNCTAVAVIRVCRVWTEENKETRRRPTGQSRHLTEREDRCFRQLALREYFALKKVDLLVYVRIRAFGLS